MAYSFKDSELRVYIVLNQSHSGGVFNFLTLFHVIMHGGKSENISETMELTEVWLTYIKQRKCFLNGTSWTHPLGQNYLL